MPLDGIPVTCTHSFGQRAWQCPAWLNRSNLVQNPNLAIRMYKPTNHRHMIQQPIISRNSYFRMKNLQAQSTQDPKADLCANCGQILWCLLASCVNTGTSICNTGSIFCVMLCVLCERGLVHAVSVCSPCRTILHINGDSAAVCHVSRVTRALISVEATCNTAFHVLAWFGVAGMFTTTKAGWLKHLFSWAA